MTKAKKVAKTTETKNSPVGNSGIPAPAKNGFNNRNLVNTRNRVNQFKRT